MLEHLNSKRVLRAKILMQNVLRRQIPPRSFDHEQVAILAFIKELLIYCLSQMYCVPLKDQKYILEKMNSNSLTLAKLSLKNAHARYCNIRHPVI